VASPGLFAEKAEAANKPIELLPEVAEGAFEVSCAGDRERHDAMVNRARSELAQKVDCIVFAQISMSLLSNTSPAGTVFKIGRSGAGKNQGIYGNDFKISRGGVPMKFCVTQKLWATGMEIIESLAECFVADNDNLYNFTDQLKAWTPR
jgi:hypothetical protein